MATEQAGGSREVPITAYARRPLAYDFFRFVSGTPYHQTPKLLQPCKQTLHFPAPPVPPQHTPVLCRLSLAVPTMWRNQRDPLHCQQSVQRVAIVGFVANQALGLVGKEALVKHRLHECCFMRTSTGNAHGDRKTRAVCHCHELRTFAALGLADACAPFLAGANVASMKHSRTSSPPCSLRCWASANSTCSSTPVRFHCWKRRWQVW